MHPKVALLVNVELEKILDAKVIRPIDYSEWIFNMVPVTKPPMISGSILILETLTKHVQKMTFHFPT